MYLELLVVRVDRGGGPTAKKYSGWRADLDLDLEMQLGGTILVSSLLPFSPPSGWVNKLSCHAVYLPNAL